jgi:3-phosphoshikimate 1-carboxyvinyltransferase
VSLPDIIEIVPLDEPVLAEITVPGSKSITNRALILAALAEGETTLQGALWSEDTQVMVECLQELGFMVNVEPDPDEDCNRTITVYGKSGVVPAGGTEEQPLELFVGNAGTATRFLAAFVCLGKGVYRLGGVPRMHERPQSALFDALRQLGYPVHSPNNKLPATIQGAGPRSGTCSVSIDESSQFASALLLCSRVGGWTVKVRGENTQEAPYVAMTRKLIEKFPKAGGRFQIEPDASSGSYFWGAGWLLDSTELLRAIKKTVLASDLVTISVARWPDSGWQIDAELVRLMFAHEPPALVAPTKGILWQNRTPLQLPIEVSRKHDLGDSIMTAIILAPFGSQAIRFTHLGSLRVQECERVVALRTELTKCGAKVLESDDTLEVFPSELHGAEIETYNDHRMAMCFAILGLKVPGIKIKNPVCVKKTFPNFFQKLAAPPPKGLGATIRKVSDGRALALRELFAE